MDKKPRPSKKGIRLRSDDVDFLRALGTIGVLDTNDACLHYPELKLNSVQNRLRLLTTNGLVRATRLMVCFETMAEGSLKGGRIPTLYSLTESGADFVETTTGIRPPRALTSDPAPTTFLHRRDISRVVTAVSYSAIQAGLDEPRWIMEQDVWHAAPKSWPPNQRRLLYHRLEYPGGDLICQPDIACRFRLPTNELVFFFEVDRSTEGHKQFRESTRIHAYTQLINRREYQRYWPDLNTQYQYLMWICKTRKRMINLQQLFADNPLAKVMRFTTIDHFENRSDVVRDPIWQNVAGETRQIMIPKS